MKRTLFTIIIVMLAVTDAWAQTDFFVNGVKYRITSKEAKEVMALESETGLTGKIEIPATVSYEMVVYNVTEIFMNVFSEREGITEVTIHARLKKIGDRAFYNCPNLTKVEILNDVTEVGIQILSDCKKLKYANFAGNVTRFYNHVFKGSSALEHVTFKGGFTSLGYGAFEECSALKELTIPAGVTKIESYTFDQCSALTKVTIPEGVTSIGGYAFRNCRSLAEVKIPDGMTTIHQHAFQYCTALQEITIPQSVTNINQYAFGSCLALKDITFLSDTLTMELGVLWGSTNVASVNWNVAVCNDFTGSQFRDCSNISEFTIGDKVKRIPACLGYLFLSLKKVTIPGNVTSIGYRAFRNCTELEKVTIGGDVSPISDKMFPQYAVRADGDAPNAVMNIGDEAFAFCPAISEMTILFTVPPTVGKDAFLKVRRDIPVYVPAEALEAYKAADGWKEFSNLKAIGSTALQTPSIPESISIQGGMLHNPQQLPVIIYDLTGRLVYSGNATTVELPAGIYVVSCNGASRKAVF